MIIGLARKKDKKSKKKGRRKKGSKKKGKKGKKGRKKKGKKNKGETIGPPAVPEGIAPMPGQGPTDLGIPGPPPGGPAEKKPPRPPKKGKKGKGKKSKRGRKGKKKEGGLMEKLGNAILGPPPPPPKKKKGKNRDKDGNIRIKVGDARAGKFITIEKKDYSSGRFEEIESYPILEPFAYVRILFDKKNLSKIYHVVEPELNKREKKIINEIKNILVKVVEIRIEDLEGNPDKYLKRLTKAIVRAYQMPVKKENFDKIFYFVRRDMLGYGPIDVLMRDPNIEDVSVDGPFIPVYIYDRRYESLETTIMWLNEEELESYVIRLAQRCNKHISVAEPLIDATLMDGSRIVMTLGREITTRGSTFTIRKFRDEPFTPTDIIDFNTMSALIVSYMWLAIQHGMSALMCGGTASGKTTSLNALALFIPKEMKIVSIEETRELNLPHPNWVPGCTREGFGGEKEAGKKSAGEVDMYDLLKAALRERPEYIVVGEIRGPEAYVLFQAMSTGHTTYSTVHADSVPSLVHRLENKPIDIPRVMIPSLDLVSIQIQTRIGEKRVRRAKEVVEIIGLDPHTDELLTNEVFRWIPATDEYEFSGKSYVLEKIMVKTNLTKDQIMDELKNRKEVLDWMVENDLRKHGIFARIVTEYYSRPEMVMKVVRGEVPMNVITGEEKGMTPPSAMEGPSMAMPVAQGVPVGGEMEGGGFAPELALTGEAEGGLEMGGEMEIPPDLGGMEGAPPMEEGMDIVGTEGGGEEDLSVAPGKVFACPTCGTLVDEEATSCPVCGEKFGEGILCPTCGAQLEPDATECSVCGETFDRGEGEGGAEPAGGPVGEDISGELPPGMGEPLAEEEGLEQDFSGLSEDLSSISSTEKPSKRVCPVCGADVGPDDTMCPACGEPL